MARTGAVEVIKQYENQRIWWSEQTLPQWNQLYRRPGSQNSPTPPLCRVIVGIVVHREACVETGPPINFS